MCVIVLIGYLAFIVSASGDTNWTWGKIVQNFTNQLAKHLHQYMLLSCITSSLRFVIASKNLQNNPKGTDKVIQAAT